MKTSIIEKITGIEAEMSQTHETNQKDAIKSARAFGWSNKPVPGEAINPYLRPFLESYSLLYKKVKKDLSKILFELEHELALCRSAISQLTEKRTDLEKQITKRKSIISELIITFTWLGLLKLICIEFLIFVSETIFNGYAFQIFGGSLLFSLFVSD